MVDRFLMSVNTVKYFSCIYCGADVISIKSDQCIQNQIKIKLIEMILKHRINAMNVAKIIKYIV